MATRKVRGRKAAPRSSARTSSRGSTRKAAGASKKRSSKKTGFRGAAGAAELQKEMKRQETLKETRKSQSNQPFRLRLNPGDKKEVIVCDDTLDDLFFQYEHNLQDPKTGYWNVFTGCTKETENCPVCEAQDKESYYALYLTVIDLTEFEDRKGNIHEFSRKLMPVKSGQVNKFLRRQEREGTLRGALFELARDGDRDPQIGNDIEFVEMVPEEELETYVREWEDKDGKVHTENCSEVLEYEELFPSPTEESLRKIVGGGTSAGSRKQAREELDAEDADMDEDEEEWDEEEEDGEWEGEEGEEEEDEELADEDEEEDGEEEEEEAPKPRGSRRSRAASGGGKSSRASGGKKRTSRAAPKAKGRRRAR